MKKLMVIGLMCFITLMFAGCSNQKGMSLKDAIQVYGNDYQVATLDSTNFLIKWDNTSLIFNNNECIGIVSVK